MRPSITRTAWVYVGARIGFGVSTEYTPLDVRASGQAALIPLGAHRVCSTLPTGVWLLNCPVADVRSPRLCRRSPLPVLVVGKSIWDPQLHGPFIIDLFVHPDVRGMGVGRALLDDAVHACARAEDATLSLRVGEGTSPAALALYTRAGFQQR